VISGAAGFLDVVRRVVGFFVSAAFVFFSFAAIPVLLLVREPSLGLVAYTLVSRTAARQRLAAVGGSGRWLTSVTSSSGIQSPYVFSVEREARWPWPHRR